jgi:hypothetical protein
MFLEMSSTTVPPLHPSPPHQEFFKKNHDNMMHGTLQHLTRMRSRILWSSHNIQHGFKKFGGTSLGLCFVYGHPKFHYFIFSFVKFANGPLQNSTTLAPWVQTWWNHLGAPSCIKDFPTVPRVQGGGGGAGWEVSK